MREEGKYLVHIKGQRPKSSEFPFQRCESLDEAEALVKWLKTQILGIDARIEVEGEPETQDEEGKKS